METTTTEPKAPQLDSIYTGRIVQPSEPHKKAVQTVVEKALAGSTTGLPQVILVTGSGRTPVIVDISRGLRAMGCKGVWRFLGGIPMIDAGVPYVETSTLPVLGVKALRSHAYGELKTNPDRTSNLVKELYPVLHRIPAARNYLLSLVRYAKADALTGTAITAANLQKIAAFYGLLLTITADQATEIYSSFVDCPSAGVDAVTEFLVDQCAEAAARIMLAGLEVPKEGIWTISPEDYVYLPVALNMPCAQYDVLVVDEAEKLSLAARKLLLKCIRRTGTLVVMGGKDDGNKFAGVRPGAFEDLAKLPGSVKCVLDGFDSNKESLSVSLNDVLAVIDSISDGKGKMHITSFKTRFAAWCERVKTQTENLPWRRHEANVILDILNVALEDIGKQARVGTLVEAVKKNMGGK